MMIRSDENSSIAETGTLWERKYTLATPTFIISTWPEMRSMSRYFATRFLFQLHLGGEIRDGYTPWVPFKDLFYKGDPFLIENCHT